MLVIYGPAKCGKTTNAMKLRDFFKCQAMYDETYPPIWDRDSTLVLVQSKFSADWCRLNSANQLSFAEAMQQAGLSMNQTPKPNPPSASQSLHEAAPNLNSSSRANSFIWVQVQGEDGLPVLKHIRYDQFVLLLLKADTYSNQANHVALGVCGEAGEFADCIKKHLHYSQPLDRDNLIEELGDLRFYIQAAQNIWNVTEQEILQANAKKLEKRYKSLAFTEQEAHDRADKKGA